MTWALVLQIVVLLFVLMIFGGVFTAYILAVRIHRMKSLTVDYLTVNQTIMSGNYIPGQVGYILDKEFAEMNQPRLQMAVKSKKGVRQVE